MPRQTHNSPTLAYIAVYGKEPDKFIRGRTNNPTKTWNGIQVDEDFKDEWLESINNIDGVEIRATDVGKDKVRVAFVVFRLSKHESVENAEKVSNLLKDKENVYSLVDIGSENRPRIVAAGRTWKGQPNWETWWDNIADHISEATSKVFRDYESDDKTENVDFGKLINIFLNRV
jgi:hypothetical protein